MKVMRSSWCESRSETIVRVTEEPMMGQGRSCRNYASCKILLCMVVTVAANMFSINEPSSLIMYHLDYSFNLQTPAQKVSQARPYCTKVCWGL